MAITHAQTIKDQKMYNTTTVRWIAVCVRCFRILNEGSILSSSEGVEMSQEMCDKLLLIRRKRGKGQVHEREAEVLNCRWTL